MTLTGPRQAGKTTLVRAVFPGHRYCNLENPELRRLASEDPKQFFHLHQGPMILDKIQRVPELLSWIQVRVENVRKFQRAVTDAKSGFVLYAGDLFPDTESYAVRHFKDTCDCLVDAS